MESCLDSIGKLVRLRVASYLFVCLLFLSRLCLARTKILRRVSDD